MVQKQKNKIEVIPAIMVKTFSNFEQKIKQIQNFVSLVQIDVIDGQFVNNISWPFSRQKNKIIFLQKEFQQLEKGKVNLEFDLMVKEPIKLASKLIKLSKTKRIIFHLKSLNDKDILKIKKLKENDYKKIEIGLAILPNVSLLKLKKIIQLFDFIQCMGIKKVGFQGQEFTQTVLKLITKIKKEYPMVPISVDGGVNFIISQKLKKAGANRIVSGSIIFNSKSIKETMDKLGN